MSVAVTRLWSAQNSPRFTARLTGALFLVTIVTGIVAQGFISQRLVVSGDAAATANNILAHRIWFQLGFTFYTIEMACQVAITALFYDLLRPVSRSVSLVAAFLGLAGCIVKAFSRVFYVAPLFVLGGSHYLNVFSPDQLQAVALLLLKVNDQGAAMALAFFGFSTLLQGYLIFRSTFLPQILGLLALCAGFAWLSFLYPPLGYATFPYVAAFGLIGAVALIAWLLLKGVDEPRWKEQARIAAI